MAPKETMKMYGVPAPTLKEYKAPAKKTNYAFDNAPEEKYRLVDEEIPGQLDQKKDQKPKEPTTDITQDPNEFEFENRSSIVIGASNMKKPGGDDIISMGDMEELTDLDNLADCFDCLDEEESF